MKIIILILLAAIFYALGSGLYYLMKEGGQSRRVVKALIWRLALSLLLFLLLFIAFVSGWIHPHGLLFQSPH